MPKGTFWGDGNGHFLIGIVVMRLDIFVKSHQTSYVNGRILGSGIFPNE